jgi:hypothetical protein
MKNQLNFSDPEFELQISLTPDKSNWFDTTCPCCGTPVKCRTTNLQMVARTGDESLAGKEYMPVPKLNY